MAKVNVIHSQDACTIVFKGSKNTPEPSTGIIKFPGGHVEVSRTSDGCYWAHIQINQKNSDEFEITGCIKESRIDYTHEGYLKNNMNIPSIPAEEFIQHIAVKIGK
jgi:hypothetical protein